MTVKNRIKTYCKAENLPISTFEKSIGASNGYVNAISKSIGIEYLSKIIEIYSNLNLEWLLTGKGEMLKTKRTQIQQNGDNLTDSIDKDSNNLSNSQAKTALHAPEGTLEGIPLIPLSAMAGAFTGETSVMEYECERYVIPAFRGADFLIQIKGDSMQPTYYSGDLVACQRMPLTDLFFQWNKAYVLDTIQGPLIKRIMPGSDDDHVLIVSDNVDYPPFELHRNQFNGVALVRGLVRLE